MTHYLSILIGIAVIVFRDKLADLAIKSQNKTWGFKFGAQETTATKIAIVGAGIFLIGTSLIALLGLNK